jgi:hypothetical protein
MHPEVTSQVEAVGENLPKTLRDLKCLFNPHSLMILWLDEIGSHFSHGTLKVFFHYVLISSFAKEEALGMAKLYFLFLR